MHVEHIPRIGHLSDVDLFVVGTRFCASAGRPDARNALLKRRSLPVSPTAFHCALAKKSTLERDRPSGSPGFSRWMPVGAAVACRERPIRLMHVEK
jgi:hypothetical protein